jgi:hypothetical protein
MSMLLMCLAAAAVGIDVGWQRIPEGGGMEYIIQLDPQTLEALRGGQAIQSDIHPGAGEVRSYRIVVGKQQLPRESPPPPPPTPKATTPRANDRIESQPAAPKTLPSDPGGKLLAERAVAFTEPDSTAATGKPQPKAATEAQPEKPARPWLPLTFALLGLFGSLSANVFLGWIAWDSRQRCRVKCGEALPVSGQK